MRFRITVCLSVLLLQWLMVVPASVQAAAGSSGVLISGLQTTGPVNSTDEFVELLNPTSAAVSLTGWRLQYRAASTANGTDCSKGWTTKATVAADKTVAAGGRYLFAPSLYMPADTSFSAGLASAAGTVRLLDASGNQADALAWGNASCGLGQPASAPAAGQSLQRHPGPDGLHGDNAADFFIQPSVASPDSNDPINPQAPAETPAPPSPAAGNTLRLSELMIDPVAPASDSQDEFVELHNAGSTPMEVAGYIIKTGSHQYQLPATTVEPDGYLVVTSADSTISLTNSGGVANLLDPTGAVVDTAATWGPAEPGASWAFIDNTWVWTLSPTPGEPNEYTPVPGTASAEDSSSYAAVQLTELLPDPAPPLTDAHDEFIELYNPGPETVDLTGYVIKVGHDLGSKYVIKDATLTAGAYLALTSATTKLALANDGSSVALYTPAGTQLGATVTYPKAASGDAWALIGGSWRWTGEPSPGQANILVEPAVGATAAAKAAKAKAAAKPKTTKATKATKAKSIKASPTKPLMAGASTPGGRWLLFILAGLTMAYIIYEFRYDLRNFYYQLRRHAGGRPAPVPALVGRGSNRAGE